MVRVIAGCLRRGFGHVGAPLRLAEIAVALAVIDLGRGVDPSLLRTAIRRRSGGGRCA